MKKIERDRPAGHKVGVRSAHVSVEVNEAGEAVIVFRRGSGMASTAEGGFGDLSESLTLDLSATPEECHDAVSWCYLWAESGPKRRGRE